MAFGGFKTTKGSVRKAFPRGVLKELKSSGVDKYFTGIKCRNGHTALRVKGRCLDCARQSAIRHQELPGYTKKYSSWWSLMKKRKPWYLLYHGSKYRAKKNKIPFSLTEEDVKLMYLETKNCPVLGIKLRPGLGNPDSAPTLDRIIPKLGYTKKNTAIISFKANRMKNNASLRELERLVDWLKKRV